MTAEERRKRLIELGYDPEQYDWVTPEEAALEDTTQLGALGTSAASAIGPTIGGLLGAAAPKTAIITPRTSRLFHRHKLTVLNCLAARQHLQLLN